MLQFFLLLLAGGGAMAAASGGGSSSRSNSDASDDDAPALSPTLAPRASAIPDDPSPDPDPVGVDYSLSWGGLSAEEQLVVELINRARMDPDFEVARLSEPLASGIPGYAVEPLAVTAALSVAARAHSEDMDDREFFAHTNLDGESPTDRAVEAGHGSRYVGENIGWIASGRPVSDAEEQPRVEMHHANLWESDGHQRGLMNENFAEIGVGYDYGDKFGYDGSTHVTEMFGNRGINYLTGVVIRDADADNFYDMDEGLGGVRVTATNGVDTYGTSTWGAGGYSLALPPGTYDVTFEGGGLRETYGGRIVMGEDNVKLDVVEDEIGAVALTSAAPPADPDASATLAALPLPEIPIDEQMLTQDDAEEDEEFSLLLW